MPPERRAKASARHPAVTVGVVRHDAPVARGGRFVRYVALDERAAGTGYPFDLPAVAGLRRAWLTLGPGVTFLVGENGSGKSTLVEPGFRS